MNVVLFGYRGSGKTTLGTALASKLGKTFADVDQHVMERFGGLTIAEIWAHHGEPAFRAAESELTIELLARPQMVLALGGGTLMQPAARAAVEKAPDTVCIYLYCQTPELYRRISGDPTTKAARPSLTALGGGIEEINSVLAQRDPVYRAVAQHILDVTSLSPAQALAALSALASQPRANRPRRRRKPGA